MSDEIISGLRNALERGESLDKAARSFLNAGYNPSEVKESVNAITQGVTDIVIQPAQQHTTPFQGLPQNQVNGVLSNPAPQANNLLIQKPKKKHTVLIITLVSILLILGGVLVSIVLLGEKILSAMSGFLK
jgi:hypothetical protein